LNLNLQIVYLQAKFDFKNKHLQWCMRSEFDLNVQGQLKREGWYHSRFYV